MQIFAKEQIKAWDEFTIQHEPIASIDLMERAAATCFDWLMDNGYDGRNFSIFCGKGNNGGDGLAIARMLSDHDLNVNIYILEFGHLGTEDFQTNLARLHKTKAIIKFVSTEDTIYPIDEGDIVIDALIGSGLSRPLEGLTATLVQHINKSGNEVISVDMPSGLLVDSSTKDKVVVKATHTLSFQCYKPAFMVAENATIIGKVHILDIRLHREFLDEHQSNYQIIDAAMVKSLIKPRDPFSHKGTYGHAAIVTGSVGMMGASILCAKACMRSGAGKLTCHVPATGYAIIQVAVPEAMSIIETGNSYIQTISSLEKYDAVGVGPGIGLYDSHNGLLSQVFQNNKHPMVIDADALNMISIYPSLMTKLPAGSVLTPHVKEFERLFGNCADDFERIKMARHKATANNLVIVLKGHHTFIATPGGTGYFNSTGNPGMATAGTGDVLTGIITGLLAQGYSPEHAAIIGVYIHGLAGDLAAAYTAQQSLIASDVIDHLGDAFQKLM